MSRAASTLLLQGILYVLELADAIFRGLLTAFSRIAAPAGGKGAAGKAGSRPPPPSVVGIILAEPDAADISIRTVSRLASWCLAYASVQQIHLYDPAGHLKSCQALLQDSISELAQQQGRDLQLKTGWCSPAGQGTGPSQQQQQGSNLHTPNAAKTRTWSDWLSQTVTGTAKRPPTPPTDLGQQPHRPQQQQQQMRVRQTQPLLPSSQQQQRQQEAASQQQQQQGDAADAEHMQADQQRKQAGQGLLECVSSSGSTQVQDCSTLDSTAPTLDQTAAAAGQHNPVAATGDSDSSNSSHEQQQGQTVGTNTSPNTAAGDTDAVPEGAAAATSHNSSSSNSSSQATGESCPAAAAAAAAAAVAQPQSNSSNRSSLGRHDRGRHSSRSSRSSAVVVRLLSAEDAFAPVLNSILDSYNSTATAACLSPKGTSPVGPKQLFVPSGSSSSSGSSTSTSSGACGSGSVASVATDVSNYDSMQDSSCDSTRGGTGGEAACADGIRPVAAGVVPQPMLGCVKVPKQGPSRDPAFAGRASAFAVQDASKCDQSSKHDACSCDLGIRQSSCSCDQSSKPPAAASSRSRDRSRGSTGSASSSDKGGGSSSGGNRAAASSKKTVLQVLYDNTTAAAAVVADAITTTAGLSSSSAVQQQQRQAGNRHQKQQHKQQQQRPSMLQEMAAATGQDELLQEPQLLLVFGPVLTLAGYPPFHARVAEMQHLGRLAGVQRQLVEDAFASYCQVLQRHGA